MQQIGSPQQMDDVHQRCDEAIRLNDPSEVVDPLTATDEDEPPKDAFWYSVVPHPLKFFTDSITSFHPVGMLLEL
jgi:hypothetical protein